MPHIHTARRPWFSRPQALFDALGGLSARLGGRGGVGRPRPPARPFRPSVEALEPLVLPHSEPLHDLLVATGAGPGAPPVVKVYDGHTGELVRSFLAYDPAFRGGVHVAVADLNGDGTP